MEIKGCKKSILCDTRHTGQAINDWGLVDEQRHLNVYIAITDNPEDEFRQFFTREVIPPSRSTSGIGQQGYVIESLYSVEIAFTKENLFVRFEYYFPPLPGNKFKSASPYATQHAPKVEVEKAFKMAMAIDQVIVGRTTMTPCNNDFYDPTFPRPTSESGKLLAAAANGETAKVKRLIYSGVSTEVSDVEGNTPLHLAIRLGCIETVRVPVDANANPNSRNAKRETPLMIAANQRNVEVTQLLIESGGDVKAKDKHGNNAAFHVLDFANYYYLFPLSFSRENVVTLLKVLKNTGLDLNFHNDLGGDTLLTYNMVDSDPTEQWSDLIGLGVDVNGVDGSGQTTLIKAIKITVPDQRRKKMVEFYWLMVPSRMLKTRMVFL